MMPNKIEPLDRFYGYQMGYRKKIDQIIPNVTSPKQN